jgi:H2-forming N5,N10-methylenetetrahydromethanopterin dehydrogenase-like enzyme
MPYFIIAIRVFSYGLIRNKRVSCTLEIIGKYLTMEKQVSIILQTLYSLVHSSYVHQKEDIMKTANIQLPKDLKNNKLLQRRMGNTEFKLRLKDQRTNRLRIGLSVTAGHVRGGHSFH